jgi:hypothetical protein
LGPIPNPQSPIPNPPNIILLKIYHRKHYICYFTIINYTLKANLNNKVLYY